MAKRKPTTSKALKAKTARKGCEAGEERNVPRKLSAASTSLGR